MKCEATTLAGNPCQASAVEGSRFCISHQILHGDKAATPPDATPNSAKTDNQTATLPPQRTKEDALVEEKKPAGFMTVAAFALSLLAVVWLVINSVRPTMTEQAMEKAMDTKFKAMNDEIMNVIRNGEVINHRVGKALLARDLENIQASLNLLSSAGDPTLTADIEAIRKNLDDLKAKVSGAPAAAPAAKPAIGAPATVAPLFPTLTAPPVTSPTTPPPAKKDEKPAKAKDKK